MMLYLDRRFATEDMFATLAGDWKGMCGLTHTGIEQTVQQFDDEGNARPVYDSAQIINSIQSATAILVLFAIPIAHYFGKPEAAKEISDAYNTKFGTTAQAKGTE